MLPIRSSGRPERYFGWLRLSGPGRLIALPLLAIGLLSMRPVDTLFGEESSQTQKESDLSTRRLELMRNRVTSAEVKSAEAGFPKHFHDQPLFRYSDPARGYVAAAVWKLGATGRPKAVLVSELIPKTQGRSHISYEFISLTKTPFSMTSADINWSPGETLYRFQPIPNAPPPDETPTRRLRQMRDLARQFTGSEVDKDLKCELRLLPQPIDRYQPATDPKADGAIFIFAFGTNPELMLLIESDGQSWQFAAGRLSGAETITLTYGGKTVWDGDPVRAGVKSPYTGSITLIEIPGLDRNGMEIRE